MTVRAIERAGCHPGSDVAISLDIAASEFGRDGRYKLALDRRELDSRRHGRDAARLDRALPHRVDRGSARRGRPRRVGSRSRAPPRHRVQIIGDDFLTTNAERIADASATRRATPC